MHRILVPVDGSASSERAIRHAITTFKIEDPTQLHLLHVQPALAAKDVPDIAKPGLIERLGVDEADRAFASTKRLLQEAGIRYSARTATGDPAQEIAIYAQAHGCTEIVMGTRGMGAIQNLVLGSVALKVLHLVKVPVTLVK